MKENLTLTNNIRQHLVFTRRHGTGSHHARNMRGWIEVARGTYIDPACLAILNKWEQERALHIARAAHAQQRTSNSLIAGPSALLCYGVEILGLPELPIHIATPSHTKLRLLKLPPIDHPQISSSRQAKLKHTYLGEDTWQQDARQPFPTLSLIDSAIQTARLLPEEQGMTAFLMSAQILARCDRHQRTDTLARLKKLSQHCLSVSEELPRKARGRQRLRIAADLVRLPVDSILEARMHWLLHLDHISGYTTQYPLSSEGRMFFADFAFPERRIIFELDGQAKYGTNREQQLENKLNELARQRLIERQGWTIYRLTWHDLKQPKQLMRWIRQAISH